MARFRVILPVAVLALVSFAPARDKKDVDRIAALEKQVAQLQQDQDAIDAGVQAAFKKTADLITRLADASNDMEERVSKLERAGYRSE